MAAAGDANSEPGEHSAPLTPSHEGQQSNDGAAPSSQQSTSLVPASSQPYPTDDRSENERSQSKLPLPSSSASTSSQIRPPTKPTATGKGGSGRTGGGKGTTLKVGDDLEYRVMRLYAFQGYFVRRGRVLYTVGKLDQATDLDVLAIRHSDLFRREVVISECKSGGEGPLDRVFWLSGLKRYVRADRAVLVRKPTKWNIKDFAKEAGIEILDLDHLTELEEKFEINRDEWPGLTDRNFFTTHIAEWNDLLKHDRYLDEMYLTFAGETRFEEPYGAVNFWVHHMRTLTREYRTPYESRRSMISYLLTEAASQLAIFITRLAALSIDLSAYDRKGLIRKKLTYGELDATLAERVLGRAHNLAQQAATHHVGGPVKIDPGLFAMPSPDYVEEISGFVEKLIASPPVTGTLAALTDIVMAESFLKGNRRLPWIKRMFRQSDYPARLAFVHTYLTFLVDLGCLPPIALAFFREP